MRRPLVFLAGLLAVGALTAAPLGHTTGSRRSATQQVTVTLEEFKIILPVKLKPGRTTFRISNRGHYPHDFVAIWGPGRFTSPTLAPGGRTTLTVTLVPGVYVVACTVLAGGHIAHGMLGLFTIGSRSPGSPIWHYP